MNQGATTTTTTTRTSNGATTAASVTIPKNQVKEEDNEDKMDLDLEEEEEEEQGDEYDQVIEDAEQKENIDKGDEEEEEDLEKKYSFELPIPTFRLESLGRGTFMIAIQVARYFQVKEVDRLFDKIPQLTRFMANEEQTGKLVEMELLQAQLKGRMVTIVRAMEVYKYLVPLVEANADHSFLDNSPEPIARCGAKNLKGDQDCQVPVPTLGASCIWHGPPERRFIQGLSNSIFENIMSRPLKKLLYNKQNTAKMLHKHSSRLMTERLLQSREFNRSLLLERRNHMYFYDLNTGLNFVPELYMPVIGTETSFQHPIALIPGQYQDAFIHIPVSKITKPNFDSAQLQLQQQQVVPAARSSDSLPITPSAATPTSATPTTTKKKYIPKAERAAMSAAANDALPSTPVSSSSSTATTTTATSNKKVIEVHEPTRTCSLCGQPDVNNEFLYCADCDQCGHPACWELTDAEMIARIRKYKWQCSDCKSCWNCKSPGDEEMLMLCDSCDRGCHTYCAIPKLDRLPSGSWICHICKGEKKAAKTA